MVYIPSYHHLKWGAGNPGLTLIAADETRGTMFECLYAGSQIYGAVFYTVNPAATTYKVSLWDPNDNQVKTGLFPVSGAGQVTALWTTGAGYDYYTVTEADVAAQNLAAVPNKQFRIGVYDTGSGDYTTSWGAGNLSSDLLGGSASSSNMIYCVQNAARQFGNGDSIPNTHDVTAYFNPISPAVVVPDSLLTYAAQVNKLKYGSYHSNCASRAGNKSVGMRFHVSASVPIHGIAFYNAIGSCTINGRIYKPSGALAAESTVGCSGTGYYTVGCAYTPPASEVAEQAYWTAALYETTGTNYTAADTSDGYLFTGYDGEPGNAYRVRDEPKYISTGLVRPSGTTGYRFPLDVIIENRT